MKREFVYDLVIRYFTLILLGIPFIGLFYVVFFPLTFYPVEFILNLFYEVSKTGSTLYINNFPIEVIDACIASSAYYLFTILNLSTPKIKIKKRIVMLLVSFGLFLVINILRIVLLSSMLVSGSTWFDVTHKFFWYFLSIVFVVGIWFYEIKKFEIKEIPFYSDLKNLFEISLLKKRKKGKRSK